MTRTAKHRLAISCAVQARYVRIRGNSSTYYGVNVVGFAEMEVHEAQGVQLTWTAPGDNGNSGTATSYEVKYSTVGAIDDETKWGNATAVVSGVPTPSVAGTAQSMTIPLTSLGSPATGTVIYFAVRAKDELPNQGGLSNAASVTVP